MNTREPRQVGLKTIFDLLKQRRTLFAVGLVFTLLPFAFGTILLFVSSLLGSDVDYDLVNKNGKTTTATVTNIETQSNITINNEHPSIISYTYSKGDEEVESQY